MAESVMQLGPSDATRALNDASFVLNFPEFKGVKIKSDMFRSGVHSGCSSCRKKTIAKNITADFLSVVGVLPPGRIYDLKKYLGADKLMYIKYDSQKGSYRTVVS